MSLGEACRRIVSAVVLASIFNVHLAALQQRQGTQPKLHVGERVEVVRLDDHHVVGTVLAIGPNRFSLARTIRDTEEILEADVKEIRDVDTGALVQMPTAGTVGPSLVKAGLIVAGVVGVIYLIRITGCFGHCNY